MIDGCKSLNNILLIAMTNRLDLIDPAILRPGRFEVHVEIGLPDENGRKDILMIHTKELRENKLLGLDVSLEEIAKHTKNYTGAELASLVTNAKAFAMNRKYDLLDFKKKLDFTELAMVES
jgi:vesicle-fusing ATPase